MKLYFRDKRVREILEAEENKSEEKNKSVQSEEDIIKAALGSLGAQDTLVSRATDLYKKNITDEDQQNIDNNEAPQDVSILDVPAENAENSTYAATAHIANPETA